MESKGLVSTEAFASLPFGGQHPLAVRSHVFELLDDDGQAHGLETARVGGVYELVVTTQGGLYRYRTGDRVEVDGFVGATPSIRFAGRADQVSDRRGEKLSEGFVAHCLQIVLGGDPAAVFALLAPEDSGGAHGALRALPRGRGSPAGAGPAVGPRPVRQPPLRPCRSLGQLEAPRIESVVHGDAVYLAACVDRGQREGDVKPAALSPRSDWGPRFARSPAEAGRS